MMQFEVAVTDKAILSPRYDPLFGVTHALSTSATPYVIYGITKEW